MPSITGLVRARQLALAVREWLGESPEPGAVLERDAVPLPGNL